MHRGKAALIRNVKGRVGALGGQQLPCSYSHRPCQQPRLDGYEYCLKHILEDKNSPYRQCSYQAPRTGRKCTNPAPKQERGERKEGGRLCLEHHKQLTIAHQKALRKRRPKETAESLLEELNSSNVASMESSTEAKLKLKQMVDSIALKALEYGSSSDSDREELSVDQAFKPDMDSDAESVDSDQEDPLKHAGVYSQEEVALLLRDKLIRLQSLYIDQFKRLQHVLKEKRRKYLQTVKQETDTLGPIQAYKQDPTQRKKYERLQAMKRYHKFHGKEALLHQKCDKRRLAVAEGVNHRPPTFPRCHVPTVDGRCNQRVVPLSKMCVDHILKDPHQVLFEPCLFRNGQCGRPVVNLDGAPRCSRHFTSLPATSSISTQTQSEEEKKIKVEPMEVKTEPVDHPEPTFTTPTTTSTLPQPSTVGPIIPTTTTTTTQHTTVGGNHAYAALPSTSVQPSNSSQSNVEMDVGTLNNPDEPLNSSGEGNLDLGVGDIMEHEDLIGLVDELLEQGDGAAMF